MGMIVEIQVKNC